MAAPPAMHMTPPETVQGHVFHTEGSTYPHSHRAYNYYGSGLLSEFLVSYLDMLFAEGGHNASAKNIPPRLFASASKGAW